MSEKRAESDKSTETATGKPSITSSPAISDDTESVASRESHESHESRRSLGNYDGSAPELHLTPYVSRINLASGRRSYTDSSIRRPNTLRRTTTTGTTASGFNQGFEVDFAEDDKQDPQNWSLSYRALIIAIMSYGTTTV